MWRRNVCCDWGWWWWQQSDSKRSYKRASRTRKASQRASSLTALALCKHQTRSRQGALRAVHPSEWYFQQYCCCSTHVLVLIVSASGRAGAGAGRLDLARCLRPPGRADHCIKSLRQRGDSCQNSGTACFSTRTSASMCTCTRRTGWAMAVHKMQDRSEKNSERTT